MHITGQTGKCLAHGPHGQVEALDSRLQWGRPHKDRDFRAMPRAVKLQYLVNANLAAYIPTRRNSSTAQQHVTTTVRTASLKAERQFPASFRPNCSTHHPLLKAIYRYAYASCASVLRICTSEHTYA